MALAALLAALPLRAGEPAAAAGEPLLVSAAVSLKAALNDLAPAFARQGGSAVLLNTAASGVLLAQIERGAPADVLLSASPLEIDRLERAGLLVPGSRVSFASNRLVLALPRGDGPIASLADLRQPRFARIAIGNPRTVPAGRYARACLDALGLGDALGSRLILAENVRQALDWVARGESDAALVYRTDLRLVPEAVLAGPEVPAGCHPPILYQGAVLRAAAQPRAARALLDWLCSAQGLKILAGHGFAPPPGP